MMSVSKKDWSYTYHIMARIIAPDVMISVSKKQEGSYFATHWPGYLLLLHVKHVMISVSKKQWFHFTTHWHEYILARPLMMSVSKK
jgi:hypothetical protein